MKRYDRPARRVTVPTILSRCPGFLRLAVMFLLIACSGSAAQFNETANPINVRPRPIGLVPPGTVVDGGPPRGWSHLIIRNIPRCSEGDVEKVPRSNVKMASLLHSVLLAKVVSDESGPYAITNIAVGCSTEIDGKDTVISPSTQKKLGARLGFLQRLLLGEVYYVQQTIRIVAQGPTLAVIDVPNSVRWRNRNQQMILRYALVLEPNSGELDTTVGLLLPNEAAADHRLVSPLEWLPPNHVDDSVLYVENDEYSWGMPSSNAYAIAKIPSASCPLTPDTTLVKLMQKRRFNETDAALLDQSLRAILVTRENAAHKP